ncbi:MAG: hypothetical protein M3P14_03085 [Chloroflexota bacterium]|nr:hypothetical protein [Chloroflexota bacterium]
MQISSRRVKVALPAALTQWPSTVDWTDLTALLMVVALGVGLGILVVTTPIGSGDYGQWLMASRHYSGQPEPGYRALGDVPPVVPLALAGVQALVREPVLALHVLDAMLLGLLVVSFYLAGAVLFRSRIAGLLAVGFAFVGTDQFTGLFAFGGLLQAASLGFSVLMVAAFTAAAHAERSAWIYWTLGSVALALAALSHLATGALGLAAGTAIALVSVARRPVPLRSRLRALVPVGVCLGLVGTWWIVVLLPGSATYVTNPASLNYRGSDRLLETLAGFWPTLVVMAAGTAAVVIGSARELLRRRPGSFSTISVWVVVAFGSLAYSVLTRAATDYPRFTTLILAPLILAASGGLVEIGRRLRASRGRVHHALSRTTGLAAATLLVLAATPMAVSGFTTAARGYEIVDESGLREAAAWIDGHVNTQETVLAPVREGKWIEGLSGRAALFSNAIRYSFRPGEWSRSLAATTLLRGSSSIVNQFFFLRTVGGSPCEATGAPSTVVVGSNHGGEYLDLLSLATSDIRVVSATHVPSTLATVSNLSPQGSMVSRFTASARTEATWTGKPAGNPLTVRQILTLTQYASAFEIQFDATSAQPIGGLDLVLRPASGVAITGALIAGTDAELDFTQFGLEDPRLRLTIAGGNGSFVMSQGSVTIHGKGTRLRLLVTDLTASERPVSDLATFCPHQLLGQYGIGAVLLTRDGSYRDRAARMAALGFGTVHEFGAYALLTRT